MIVLEYWQAGVVLALFGYAIAFTTRKFMIKGVITGYHIAIDELADREMNRALKYLVNMGIITIEKDSDGEDVIVPVQFDEDEQ